MTPMFLNRVGLLLNFVGSVLIALSVGKPPSEAYQTDNRGRKISFAVISRPWALWGLVILIFGFAASLIATSL
jgi:hypothetical protein